MSETEDQVGFLERAKRFADENRAGVITGAIALILAIALFCALLNTSVQPQVKQPPPPIQIQIQRTKTPPPPPPKIPQEKQITPPKTITPVQKTFTPHTPPKAAPPKANAAPPALGTSIHNGNADGFAGLANGGGDGVVGGTGDGGGGGSYEGAVAADIEAALVKNPVTRNANAGLEVRIWLNADGTVTQVQIDKSSGDPQVDTAVKDQVLAGMHLPPPPAGTAMPISMSLTGQQTL
jgi:TonB family protein